MQIQFPLYCSPNYEYKDYKSTVLWTKILNYLENSKDASETCLLFRTIVWLKKITSGKSPIFSPLKLNSFEEMATMSKRLPTFRMLKTAGATGKDGIPTNKILYETMQLISHEQFKTALKSYFEVIQDQVPLELANITNRTFHPYAEKVVVAPGTRCIFRGDCHGDLPSLLNFINQLQKNGDTSPTDPLKFIKPFKLFFLGDYVDRGIWGLEVIYVLMLLKIKNPESFFLIRGNHEDPVMADTLGFFEEYKAKFRKDDPEYQDYKNMTAFYHTLPVVLYLGTEKNFVQCCHGGMEWGYNPKTLLNEDKRIEEIKELKRFSKCPKCQVEEHGTSKKTLKGLHEVCSDYIPETPKNPFPVGFMWHEFHVNPDETTAYYEQRKVFSCSKELTSEVFKAASVGEKSLVAAIRAHQHAPNNPLMTLLLNAKGCVKLWNDSLVQGEVLTLLLTPDNDSGLHVGKEYPFTYDTTLEVTTASKFEDWKTVVTNNEIY